MLRTNLILILYKQSDLITSKIQRLILEIFFFSKNPYYIRKDIQLLHHIVLLYRGQDVYKVEVIQHLFCRAEQVLCRTAPLQISLGLSLLMRTKSSFTALGDKDSSSEFDIVVHNVNGRRIRLLAVT